MITNQSTDDVRITEAVINNMAGWESVVIMTYIICLVLDGPCFSEPQEINGGKGPYRVMI